MYKCKGFLVSEQERAAYLALQAACSLFPFHARKGVRTGADIRDWEQGIQYAALLIVYETGLRPSNARALALSVLQKPWFD